MRARGRPRWPLLWKASWRRLGGISNLAIEVTVAGAGRLLSALLRTSLLCPYAFRARGLKTRCSASRFRGSSTRSIPTVERLSAGGAALIGAEEDMAPSVRVRPRACPGPPARSVALGRPMGEAMLPGAPGELEPDVGLRAAWEAPNWFAEEVVDVDGREELRANDDWSVVSFVEEGDRPARSPRWRAGGTRVGAGGQRPRRGVWTGVKGRRAGCSWLALSCTRVGDALSAVRSSKCADGMRGDAGERRLRAFAR